MITVWQLDLLHIFVEVRISLYIFFERLYLGCLVLDRVTSSSFKFGSQQQEKRHFASLIGYFERLIVRVMIDMFIKKKKISSLLDKENEFPNYEFQGFPLI